VIPLLPARVCLMAGLLGLGYAAYVVIDTQAYQAIEHRRLESARSSPSSSRQTIADGGVIGEIQIPRLGLRAIVAQGHSAAVLQRAVGHLALTALPGEPGNVVLAGHRDTFFRPLKRARAGDAITLQTRAGDFEYLVEWTAVVPPTDLEVIQPTNERSLTLITCFPFSYVGPAADRFIVRARAVEGSRPLSARMGSASESKCLIVNIAPCGIMTP
jgi:sortase A